MLTFALNAGALAGWCAVLALTVPGFFGVASAARPSESLLRLTLGCVLLCATETLKIALGKLRGDLALSATVQYTRLLMLFATLPRDLNQSKRRSTLTFKVFQKLRSQSWTRPGNSTIHM